MQTAAGIANGIALPIIVADVDLAIFSVVIVKGGVPGSIGEKQHSGMWVDRAKELSLPNNVPLWLVETIDVDKQTVGGLREENVYFRKVQVMLICMLKNCSKALMSTTTMSYVWKKHILILKIKLSQKEVGTTRT